MKIEDVKFAPEKLRSARKRKRLTLAEVGALLGVTKQAVSNYENGHDIPTCHMLIKLCMVYGVPVQALSTAESSLLESLHTEYIREIAELVGNLKNSA